MRWVAAVEVNLTCGDRKKRQVVLNSYAVFGTTKVVCGACEQLSCNLPLIAKLSVDVHDLTEKIAHGCLESDASGLVVTDFVRALTIDLPRLISKISS